MANRFVVGARNLGNTDFGQFLNTDSERRGPVFVFGSNEAGIHGAGAALTAYKSLAPSVAMVRTSWQQLRTPDSRDTVTLPLPKIQIRQSLHQYATEHPELLSKSRLLAPATPD
jgi:hypothetical protein